MNFTTLTRKVVKHLRQGTFLGALKSRVPLPLQTFFDLQKVRKEEKAILDKLKSGKIASVVWVYDNFSSPPTYGDFTDHLMIGRFFQSFQIKVTFFLLTDDFRPDWQSFDSDRLNRHLAEQIEIASGFLRQKPDEFVIGSFGDLLRFIRTEGDGLFVPFEEKILNRRGIYKDCLALLPLLYRENPDDCSFLLNEQLKPKLLIPKRQFITWHVRAGGLWSQSADIGEEDFLYQFKKLHRLISDSTDIMVMTSINGYQVLKPIATKHNLRVSFSKDTYHSYLDDAALTLASNLFIQFSGGGLFTIPAYSLTPYYLTRRCYESADQEKFRQLDLGYTTGKLKPWSTPFQILENSLEPNWRTLGALIKKLNL
jgi:hypothetical protein